MSFCFNAEPVERRFTRLMESSAGDSKFSRDMPVGVSVAEG